MKQNLKNCPVCKKNLNPMDANCQYCRYAEITDELFVNTDDREDYRRQLGQRGTQWRTFHHELISHITKFSKTWKDLEKWDKFWASLRVKAQNLNFSEGATIDLSKIISAELKQDDDFGHIKQVVRLDPHESSELSKWVSTLTDGTFNVVEWGEFLKTLGDLDDDEQAKLKIARDEEIARQFLEFQAITFDSEGEIYRQPKVTRQHIEQLDNQCGISMVKIPAGEFRMGMDKGYPHEKPVRTVRVAEFYLGRFPVVQAQWSFIARREKVKIELEENPSYFKGERRPVDSISWEEAVEFCARLAQLSGKEYRLPTEAEWEYAARAGSRKAYAYGDFLTPQVANYDDRNSLLDETAGVFRGETVNVGSLDGVNSFGISDMHGNIWEWCSDEWTDGDPLETAAGGAKPSMRVLRGGAWCNLAEICRSSERIGEFVDRKGKLNYLGFRLAWSPSSDKK